MDNLYLKSGYLNQEWIERQADKNGISFIVEIGGRQVGKTYGVLERRLKQKSPFILMRRTSKEADFITSGINSPFSKYKGYEIKIKKDSEYTAAIFDGDGFIGSVMSLSTVAKIRGFNGDPYTDLVYDEFIPENHVIKIKDEGDAFLNAIVTISGNRELDGIKPLRVWLLANANTISSPILQALDIQTKVNDMMCAGQEYSILRDRGIMIILPKSEQLMQKRKQTALMKAIRHDTEFARMAFDNEFAYNDSSNICTANIKEYKPLFSIAGKFTAYKHKSESRYYVTNFESGSCEMYMPTERDLTRLYRQRGNALKLMYIKGKVFFSDLVVKSEFVNIFVS